MEKSFATDDHAALAEAAGGSMFQYFERSDRMTKSASDVIGRADIQRFMPPDDHFGVHLITMGAEETFGPNRNGDSASQHSLDSHHHTFEKFGCVFREHKNRCQKTQGVGQVKLARVNPKMHRGELIVWVDKDKAPDMYKKAKAGEELSWSMSMRLPWDECSCCKQKSRTTADYCSHLKNDMLKFLPGHQKYAYARNEENVKFFDISEVKRRADRIATFLGYTFADDTMRKAASEGDLIITGAEWADLKHGVSRLVPLSPWEELTLEKLAGAMEFVQNTDDLTRQVLLRMAPTTLAKSHVDILAEPDFRSVSGELAKRAMMVNFPTFASLITGRDAGDLMQDCDCQDAMSARLPSLLTDLLRAGGAQCGMEVAESVTPDECGCAFSPKKDSIDRLMKEVGGELGMDTTKVHERAMRMTQMKCASVPKVLHFKALDPFFEGMVEAYGHYIVKAAHIAKDAPGVSETTLFRAIAATMLATS